MKPIKVVSVVLASAVLASQGFAFEEAGRKRPWSVSVRYGESEHKLEFDTRQTGTITAQGGATYTSSAGGTINFEVDKREAAAAINMPRWGAIQWELFAATVGYEVWLPSGPFVNRLKEGHGYSVGISAGIEMLPMTLVTPKVEMRLGWSLGRSRLGELALGESGTTQPVENRLDLEKKSVLITALKPLKGGRWTPKFGAELFRTSAELIDLKDGESLSGDHEGYRLLGGVSWNFSESESLSLEGFFGEETGYQLAFRQVF